MKDYTEAARLRALLDLDVLDTPPEDAFDRLTALAADLFDAPMALVSLIDAERQWFKSKVGVDSDSTPRSQAFCAHAIEMDAHATMVVPDATRDVRFADNPLVTGDPNVRFYTGAVLTSHDGFNLGTLCVVDSKPRPAPDEKALRRLRALADLVVDELELRRLNRLAAERQNLLEMAERVAGVGHWRYIPAEGGLVWSDEVYRIHGVTPDDFDLRFQNAIDFYHKDDVPVIDALVAEALKTGVGYESELRLYRADGALRHVCAKAECLFDQHGRVTGLLGTFQDITERKAVEAEMARARDVAQEQARRAVLAESVAGLGHWRLDAKTQRIEWSREMYRIYGLPLNEPVNLPDLMAMTHPDDVTEGAERRLRQLAQGGPRLKTLSRIYRTDGQLRYLAGTSMAERNSAGEIVALVGTAMDVTEQKAAETALAASERRFRSLAEHAPDIIAESGLDGVMTYVSPACLKITGYRAEELVGKTSFSLMHQDDAPKMMAMCQTVFAAKGAIPPWPVEFRAIHKAGHEIWLESKPTLVRDDEGGRFIGLTDVIRDITTRKALEAQLRQAQADAEAAAAVKGEFLANMSHELRTPLTSIIGFTRLAGEQAELAPLTRNYVDRVEDASRALLCTVNDILDFSKLEAGQVSFEPQPVSLYKLSRATLDLFTPQAGAKDLTLALDGVDEDSDLVIKVDPDRIRQILLNFVSNAVKFTEAGGVTLRTAYDLKGGDLTIQVVDTGAGVPPAKQALLFKRFSQIDGSLTRAQSGTGLGLAICKGLVEAMGGEIGVSSVEGQGSTFWFRIPVVQAELPDEADEASAEDQLMLSGVRVLVVDDHPANRELARLYLTGIGAEISEAVNGEDAVRMAMELPYDVILMDMRMPVLDGPGALARLRTEPGPNDAAPVLAFTAEAGPDTEQRLMALGFQGVVPKPLEPGVLIAAVTRATAFAENIFMLDDADVA